MTLRSTLFWVSAGCCVVAEFVLLRSLLFGRARAAERQAATGSPASVPQTRRPVEIAWAILPAIGLIFVLYLTWRAVDAPNPSAADVTPGGATIGAI